MPMCESSNRKFEVVSFYGERKTKVPGEQWREQTTN